jgi:hypothetical protein
VVLKYGPDDNSISAMMVDNYMELEPFLLFANAIRSTQTGKKIPGKAQYLFRFYFIAQLFFEREVQNFYQKLSGESELSIKLCVQICCFSKRKSGTK